MSETTILKTKSEDLKNILLDYYRNVYNDESVDIIFKSNIVFEGIYDSKKLVTKIFLIRNKSINLRIGKAITTIKEELTVNDIKEVLENALEEPKYQISNIIFETVEEPYGIYEDTRISFKGIDLTLKKKEVQKKLRR